jgi:hypothetical protein
MIDKSSLNTSKEKKKKLSKYRICNLLLLFLYTSKEKNYPICGLLLLLKYVKYLISFTRDGERRGKKSFVRSHLNPNGSTIIPKSSNHYFLNRTRVNHISCYKVIVMFYIKSCSDRKVLASDIITFPSPVINHR